MSQAYETKPPTLFPAIPPGPLIQTSLYSLTTLPPTTTPTFPSHSPKMHRTSYPIYAVLNHHQTQSPTPRLPYQPPPHSETLPSHGTEWNSPQQVTQQWTNSFPPLNLDSQNFVMNSPNHCKSISNSETTCTPLMALYSTRNALSYHQHFASKSWCSFTLPTKALHQWRHELRQQSSGQE